MITTAPFENKSYNAYILEQEQSELEFFRLKDNSFYFYDPKNHKIEEHKIHVNGIDIVKFGVGKFQAVDRDLENFQKNAFFREQLDERLSNSDEILGVHGGRILYLDQKGFQLECPHPGRYLTTQSWMLSNPRRFAELKDSGRLQEVEDYYENCGRPIPKAAIIGDYPEEQEVHIRHTDNSDMYFNPDKFEVRIITSSVNLTYDLKRIRELLNEENPHHLAIKMKNGLITHYEKEQKADRPGMPPEVAAAIGHQRPQHPAPPPATPSSDPPPPYEEIQQGTRPPLTDSERLIKQGFIHINAQSGTQDKIFLNESTFEIAIPGKETRLISEFEPIDTYFNEVAIYLNYHYAFENTMTPPDVSRQHERLQQIKRYNDKNESPITDGQNKHKSNPKDFIKLGAIGPLNSAMHFNPKTQEILLRDPKANKPMPLSKISYTHSEFVPIMEKVVGHYLKNKEPIPPEILRRLNRFNCSNTKNKLSDETIKQVELHGSFQIDGLKSDGSMQIGEQNGELLFFNPEDHNVALLSNKGQQTKNFDALKPAQKKNIAKSIKKHYDRQGKPVPDDISSKIKKATQSNVVPSQEQPEVNIGYTDVSDMFFNPKNLELRLVINGKDTTYSIERMGELESKSDNDIIFKMKNAIRRYYNDEQEAGRPGMPQEVAAAIGHPIPQHSASPPATPKTAPATRNTDPPATNATAPPLDNAISQPTTHTTAPRKTAPAGQNKSNPKDFIKVARVGPTAIHFNPKTKEISFGNPNKNKPQPLSSIPRKHDLFFKSMESVVAHYVKNEEPIPNEIIEKLQLYNSSKAFAKLPDAILRQLALHDDSEKSLLKGNGFIQIGETKGALLFFNPKTLEASFQPQMKERTKPFDDFDRPIRKKIAKAIEKHYDRQGKPVPDDLSIKIKEAKQSRVQRLTNRVFNRAEKAKAQVKTANTATPQQTTHRDIPGKR